MRGRYVNLQDLGNDNIVNVPTGFDKVAIKIRGNRNHVDLSQCSAAKINDVNIMIEGDDCSLRIGDVRRLGRLRLVLKDGGKIEVSDMTSIEEAYLLATNRQSITIGKDCMVSFQVTMRTTDAHGIYDLSSGDLTNPPGPITLGDHVWVGQGAMLSTNTKLNKNCIVGARSYVRNIDADRNCIVAGVPAKRIKENIIWDRRMADNFRLPGANVDPQFYQWMD